MLDDRGCYNGFMGCWGLNPGLHASWESTLPAEPHSPSPLPEVEAGYEIPLTDLLLLRDIEF